MTVFMLLLISLGYFRSFRMSKKIYLLRFPEISGDYLRIRQISSNLYALPNTKSFILVKELPGLLIKSYFYLIFHVSEYFRLLSDVLAKRKNSRDIVRNNKCNSMLDVPSVPKILHIYISSKSPPWHVGIHTPDFSISKTSCEDC